MPTISLITFGSSLLLLLVLFVGQSRESKSGSKNLINKGAGLLDGVAGKMFDFVLFRWKQLSQTVRYIVFIVIPQRSEDAFKEMKTKALGSYEKQKETLMGKKNVLNSSSASFFLKKMREEKKQQKEGKIEDPLVTPE